MKSLAVVLLALTAHATHASAELVVSFGSGGDQFNMSFVPIGNPGNAADTTGNPNPVGAVDYKFFMGKHEVSRDMIAKANSLGGLGITYITGPNSAIPATNVSWNEAVRFVNWLNTSQGYQPAYKFTTQPGDVGYDSNQHISLWVLGDAGYNPANPYRNSQAQYFLPSVDEWYKAAYYDPNANGGAGGYWDYPTGSNTAPTPVASGTAANTAVHSGQASPAEITLAGGLSPYGTMGQGGNVWEWEETDLDLVNDSSSSARGWRGGDWGTHSSWLLSSSRNWGVFPTPASENWNLGFRVAMAAIPESSSLLFCSLALAGVSCRLWLNRRVLRRAVPQ
ncbi:MAG: SUMF1/EgtB/PvdO family nonheme iron enzyme [Pirellulales bacterium]|nr:SUMF1/EgtB/PvdO family nonheme iron enzyme [Pirellulales bacterium]